MPAFSLSRHTEHRGQWNVVDRSIATQELGPRRAGTLESLSISSECVVTTRWQKMVYFMFSILVLVKKLNAGVRDGPVVRTDEAGKMTRFTKQFVRRAYLGMARIWQMLVPVPGAVNISEVILEVVLKMEVLTKASAQFSLIPPLGLLQGPTPGIIHQVRNQAFLFESWGPEAQASIASRLRAESYMPCQYQQLYTKRGA
ncbi:hypothetical protein BDFG_01112 [Blastomyces dermatitidis ATCC 26199]|nr:hypothetical protein BDFG_01112 [Blastomyces dermatitidis ATCC 26199]